MNIINDLRINIRKLATYKLKAIFLIVPVILLMGLSVIITSEATNIQQAAETSIFTTLTNSNAVLELNKNSQNSRFINLSPGGASGSSTSVTTGARPGSSTSTEDLFTESDLSKILSIPHVQTANMVSGLPLSNVVAKNVFTDKTFTVGQLAGIDTKLATNYTSDVFEYKDGEAIPIVLNSNDFISRTEEWGGKTTYTVTFSRSATPGSAEPETPIKTQAIQFTKDELIGKEFTMEIGGLDAIQDYKIEPGANGITFTKLSADEQNTQEANRKAVVSIFWNYSEIKKPITYKFKIVGVIEDSSVFYSFIPQQASYKIMHDYIQHQLDARSSTALSNADLDSKFQGLTWDNTELRQSGVSGFGGVGGGVRIRFGNGGIDNSANYTIPGLVIKVDRTTNEVEGAFTNPDVFKSSSKTSSVVLVKVDDVNYRGDVVTALNSAGFAYQDVSNLGVISELRSTLNNIVLGAAVGFVILSVLVIIITMGKFVSDSRREIGVFRALGATKGEIRMLFLSQSIMYVVFGYIGGAIAGLTGVFALTSVIHTAFDNFIGSTLKETFAVVNPVSSEVFAQINWQMFGVFSLTLLVITVITSLIPATTAANVSPVEAIRGE